MTMLRIPFFGLLLLVLAVAAPAHAAEPGAGRRLR